MQHLPTGQLVANFADRLRMGTRPSELTVSSRSTEFFYSGLYVCHSPAVTVGANPLITSID